MCTKAEWKQCAERRLEENIALRTILNIIEKKSADLLENMRDNGGGPGPTAVILEVLELVGMAHEVGK